VDAVAELFDCRVFRVQDNGFFQGAARIPKAFVSRSGTHQSQQKLAMMMPYLRNLEFGPLAWCRFVSYYTGSKPLQIRTKETWLDC